jgi:glutaredoxin 3
MLNRIGNRYTNIDLRKDPDGPAIRAELGALVGRTSVPAIWIQQQFIGGCNDGGPTNGGIVALQNSNQLDTMLQAAGAI